MFLRNHRSISQSKEIVVADIPFRLELLVAETESSCESLQLQDKFHQMMYVYSISYVAMHVHTNEAHTDLDIINAYTHRHAVM